MTRTAPDRDGGFTLVELLLVIVIIGVLAGIALPVMINQKSKAQRATLISDLRSMALAQESHFVEEGAYAADEDELAAEGFRRSAGVAPLDISVYTVNGSSAFCVRAAIGPVQAWLASVAGAASAEPPDPANCPT